MSYVRISLMKPMPGERETVERINKELVSHYSAMKGYITGYVLEAAGGANEVCRLTMWESGDDADHAATDERTLPLRADLRLKVQRGHTDRAFTTIWG